MGWKWIVLTGRSARGRGSGALVGRVDVEDLDVPRWSVVDEKIVRGAQLDEDGSGASCLRGGLLLLHRGVGVGTSSL